MHSQSVPRRRHSAEFKTRVLAACDEPGASISGVALAHGLNANLVRKWRSGRGVNLHGVTLEPLTQRSASSRPVPAVSPPPAVNPEFMAIEIPTSPKTTAGAAAQNKAAPSAEPLIHVELRRGALHLSVRWPTSAANDCTAWLRELSSGLLK